VITDRYHIVTWLTFT